MLLTNGGFTQVKIYLAAINGLYALTDPLAGLRLATISASGKFLITPLLYPFICKQTG